MVGLGQEALSVEIIANGGISLESTTKRKLSSESTDDSNRDDSIK